jgi:hypothetical protein
MGFGGFFVLKIVVLFLMRGWSHIFTIKGQANANNAVNSDNTNNANNANNAVNTANTNNGQININKKRLVIRKNNSG